MAAPLNPQQFGPFVPRGMEHGGGLDQRARVQAIAGGYDKLQAYFPNAKAGHYPAKENRRTMTPQDTVRVAEAYGYGSPN